MSHSTKWLVAFFLFINAELKCVIYLRIDHNEKLKTKQPVNDLPRAFQQRSIHKPGLFIILLVSSEEHLSLGPLLGLGPIF